MTTAIGSGGIRACAAALVLATAGLLSGQQATGSLSGNVFCNDGNVPARGAKVALLPMDRLLFMLFNSSGPASSEGTPASTTTDFNGSYEFSSVPGTYVINATLDGYDDDLKLALSVLDRLTADDRKQLVAAFPQVTVKAGTTARKDLVIRRAGAISGRVSVDLGGILGNVQVTATRFSGALSVGESSSHKNAELKTFTQSSRTDDRGDYRIAGLPAGKYRISLRVSESYFGAKQDGSGGFSFVPERPGTAELTVYASEALDESSAKTFEVNDGDEITGADISVPTRGLHSIGGIVTEGGAPKGGATISIEPQGGSAYKYTTISMPDGTYRFDLLPSGSYLLRAKPSANSAPARLSGEDSVLLQNNDILDVNIDLKPASKQD